MIKMRLSSSREERMKKFALLWLVVACVVSVPYAETHLSGDIKTATIDSTGNPYIVDQDVVVPAGKVLTIKPGAVFLFKAFTGLNVFGRIHVAGSSKRPVVFTSMNDGDYNSKSDQLPNPFDWNGVLVEKESPGALFENFQLRYSVYGLKSQIGNITIQNGFFKQNGQFHFTINDKIQYVQDNIAYSYSPTVSESTQSTAGGSAGNAVTAPENQPRKKTSKTTLIFRFSSLGVGVVGIAVGSLLYSPWNNAKNNVYEVLGNSEAYHDPGTAFNKAISDVNSYGGGMVASYGLAFLGLVGFGVSFAF